MNPSADAPARDRTRPVLGCVVIGRNEGERLRRCLESLAGRSSAIVYVDSGSTDGSLELARKTARVVELDTTRPFTAARARNAGYEALKLACPALDLVQFVDGDCTVVDGWLEAASEYLATNPGVAIVCGRRRESNPDASVYNGLCDIEWDTPVGPTKECGGDAMMRASAFDRVGGFDPSLIAGEEPELCVRVRAQGFGIVRLPLEMTLHDAAMYRFSQWWKRTVRSGYAYAEGAHLHGIAPERHRVRELRRTFFWGAALPAAIVLGLRPTAGASALLGLGYFVSGYRIYRGIRPRARSRKAAFDYALFTTLGKFATLQGALRFYRARATGSPSTLIEYKQ